MGQQAVPPMRPSDEASESQLDLARQQGDAFGRAVRQMTSEVAEGGAEKRAGEFLVAYAIEKAEGMWKLRDRDLKWVEPREENAHIEIVVRDASDGRFVPYLIVTGTLVDAQGRVIGTYPHPFLWHPWVYHYGRDWTVPGDGSYTLRIHIEAPMFARHDKENGKRYAQPVDVEFTAVQIRTGRAS